MRILAGLEPGDVILGNSSEGRAGAPVVARISEFGFSPNKTAALGMNLLLLVNLGWSALLYARFLTGRAPFARLERWQTAYMPAFAAWAWIVTLLFPVIFNYR